MTAAMTESEPTQESSRDPARAPVRLPLSQLRKGDRAMVASSNLSDEDRAVLQAMGLDERCTFTVCRASTGGPCIIQLDATRLGLSPELAKRILTRPCECPETGCRAQDAEPKSDPKSNPTQ
jgi:Fe2+ transport system protein FeoA